MTDFFYSPYEIPFKHFHSGDAGDGPGIWMYPWNDTGYPTTHPVGYPGNYLYPTRPGSKGIFLPPSGYTPHPPENSDYCGLHPAVPRYYRVHFDKIAKGTAAHPTIPDETGIGADRFNSRYSGTFILKRLLFGYGTNDGETPVGDRLLQTDLVQTEKVLPLWCPILRQTDGPTYVSEQTGETLEYPAPTSEETAGWWLTYSMRLPFLGSATAVVDELRNFPWRLFAAATTLDPAPNNRGSAEFALGMMEEGSEATNDSNIDRTPFAANQVTTWRNYFILVPEGGPIFLPNLPVQLEPHYP